MVEVVTTNDYTAKEMLKTALKLIHEQLTNIRKIKKKSSVVTTVFFINKELL